MVDINTIKLAIIKHTCDWADSEFFRETVTVKSISSSEWEETLNIYSMAMYDASREVFETSDNKFVAYEIIAMELRDEVSKESINKALEETRIFTDVDLSCGNRQEGNVTILAKDFVLGSSCRNAFVNVSVDELDLGEVDAQHLEAANSMFEAAAIDKLTLPYNFAPRNIEEIFASAEIRILANSKRDGYNDEYVVRIDGRNIETTWCAFAHSDIKTNIKIVGTRELRYIHRIIDDAVNVNIAIEGETCRYGIVDGDRILHLDSDNSFKKCMAVLDLSKLKLSEKEHEILKREANNISARKLKYKIIL